MEPLRVYVGLNSAETADQRAALALAELIRVGAFGRSVLVIATPTGTAGSIRRASRRSRSCIVATSRRSRCSIPTCRAGFPCSSSRTMAPTRREPSSAPV